MSFNKEIWGNNIWYLFHCIAHKIKENEFDSNKNDLFLTIKIICDNLPCPDCAKDASELLNKIDISNIKTKQEFKVLLFNFHNYINKKLNKPLFNLSDLDSKYSKCNINVVINNFYIIFTKNSNIPQLMNSSFHRKYNLPKIKNLLNKIILILE